MVRLQGSNRYDSREGGGRVAPGAATESRVWNGDREQRLEQLPSKRIKQMTCMDALMPRGYDCTDAGDRVKQEARAEDIQDDSKDGGGRVVSGTTTERPVPFILGVKVCKP